MSDSTAIQIEGLQLRREITILDQLDWTVRKAENWVLLGANGSGKTSLLGVLNAYMTPSRGRITVAGQTYGESDWRELRKRIGMVSSSVLQKVEGTETALEVVASGQDAVINYWGEISAELHAKALEALKQVECAHFADRQWIYLSQGERQRVLIGRALMADLKVLILDEPCAGLDPVAREKFLRYLGRFINQPDSPPVILVTHHVEEILPEFSHVLLLHEGKVLAQGPREEVLTSENLSQTFNAPLKLHEAQQRYRLSFQLPESSG